MDTWDMNFIPKGFSRHWFGRWINTSVSHNQHHQYFKGNYGLYFTFWDRLMGTIRTDYEQRFEEVVTALQSNRIATLTEAIAPTLYICG